MNLSIFESVINISNHTSDSVFSLMFVILLAAIALFAIAVPQGDRKWWGVSGLLAVLVIASQIFMQNKLVHTLLLDMAALAAITLIWLENSLQAKSAARTYLVMFVLAVVCMETGHYLAEGGSQGNLAKVAVALLVSGFSLKLAFIPFYFWLPKVAESARPMTTALVVSVIDIAAFQELLHLRMELPWVFTEYYGVWMAIALLSMIGGALLALSQHNIKRMLAFSTIDDMGYLLLGVMIGTTVSMEGAVLAAVSHAFFKVILFAAVAVAENKCGELTLSSRGIASSCPVSSAAFILASIGMIGVPPFLGFTGRWRLYLSGYESGSLWLILAMVLATALALLYYVRAIHRVWLGQADTETSAAEPAMAKVVLIVLIAMMLIAGLYPILLTGSIG